MNNIKHLRELFGYSQENFAKMLNVPETDLMAWEMDSEMPHYEKLKFMSEVLGISMKYIEGRGIFENWDNVLKYYDTVSYTLQELIPDGLEMPYFDEHKLLGAWIDTRMYSEHDELQIIRWFAFAVSSIEIVPPEDDEHDPEVSIEFTEDFNAIIDYHLANPPRRKIYPWSYMATEFVFKSLNSEGQKKAFDYVSDLVDSGLYSPTKARGEHEA